MQSTKPGLIASNRPDNPRTRYPSRRGQMPGSSPRLSPRPLRWGFFFVGCHVYSGAGFVFFGEIGGDWCPGLLLYPGGAGQSQINWHDKSQTRGCAGGLACGLPGLVAGVGYPAGHRNTSARLRIGIKIGPCGRTRGPPHPHGICYAIPTYFLYF